MKVKLNGIDRVMIPIILQKALIEGSELEIITIREVKKEIIEMIEIKPNEYNQYNIRMGKDMMLWDSEKILAEKEFDFKKSHTELLKQARQVLNENRQINQEIVDTCLKIRDL